MKKSLSYLYILVMLSLSIAPLYAAVHIVNQDGTNVLTSIQEAINRASVNGDTIIVYPGRYFECIDYLGKNVYLTSLYKYTNDRKYIYDTIIDGNQRDAVVKFINLETRAAVINGFTIENGIGTLLNSRGGGGITIYDSNPSILNCIIQNNRVMPGGGGGICVTTIIPTNTASAFLSGNIIKNNVAQLRGGGLIINHPAFVEFDEINKNSIFCNVAHQFGHDIYSWNFTTYMSVVLDTFTIASQNENYILMGYDFDFSFDNYALDLINSDLYVSPYGDDNNDGLTEATPFKSVWKALYLIDSDPLQPKTVYLAPGVYSPSTGQIFPMQMKSFVTLCGAGPEFTIFDSEETHNFIYSPASAENYEITGISFENCTYNQNYRLRTIVLRGMNSVRITNCHIKNCYDGIFTDFDGPVANLHSDGECHFKDLIFDNNVGRAFYVWGNRLIYENIIIRNHHSTTTFNDPSDPFAPLFYGPNVVSQRVFSDSHPMRSTHIYSNMLIYNNETRSSDGYSPPWGGINNAITLIGKSDFYITNLTVVDNYGSDLGGALQSPLSGISTADNAIIKVYNSIFYRNRDNRFSVGSTSSQAPACHLYIDNTLFENIYYMAFIGPNVTAHWGDNVLDTNPLFDESEDILPYQLRYDSPCIDAGTLDIDFPDYELPATDVLGNPRVVGATIDMGAIEYQGMIAYFIAEPDSGVYPLTVQFIDRSSGEPNAWEWDFDCDGIIDSEEQNPSYTYTEAGIYSVRLILNGGERHITRENLINVTSPTGVIDDVLFPTLPSITEAYPNPFRGRTMLNLTVNDEGRVSLTIYNIKGQKVKTLSDERRITGIYPIIWDGKDEYGNRVASGIYTIEMKHNGKRIDSRKVTYLK